MRRSPAALAALLALVAPRAVRPAPPGCEATGVIEITGMGSLADEVARVAELTGAVEPRSRLVRRGGSRTETVCAAPFPWPASARPRPADDAAHHEPSARTLPLRLSTAWNARYPRGGNDGLLWAGRGVSQLLEGGAEVRWGPFTAALAPEVAWSENRAFDLVPNGRSGDLAFGNGFYPAVIDLPQRFGSGPFATWGPGQSHVRLDAWNVALGLSTESLWIGPGVRSSILMSNAGPGFPHAFVGTSRPADIRIGKLEALLFYGRLERTRFVYGGTHPMISGLVLAYSPRWIPGLHLGLGRVMLQRWDDLALRDWLAIFQSFRKGDLVSRYGPEGDNPRDNQLASLFARWVFPESGLELYGEWAREDHEWGVENVLREPDHSQAYLLGLQKVFGAGTRRVRLLAELSHLQEQRPLDNLRGVPVYYVHGEDLGYTHRGQLLGAFAGPGSDAQTLAIDVFHRGGRVGGYVERIRRNDAYYWAVVEPQAPWQSAHDVEIALGLRQALAAGPFEVGWEAAAAYRFHRDFLRDEPNVTLAVSLALPLARPAATPRGAGAPPAAGTIPPPP